MVPLWLVVVILAFSADCSVQLLDNAYTQVTVAIGEQVAHDERLIDAVQQLFRRGSAALYKAARRRAFFGDVTILVPSHWNCTQQVGLTSLSSLSSLLFIKEKILLLISSNSFK